MKWNLMPIKSVALGIYDGPHATPKESSDGGIFLGIDNLTEKGAINFTKIRFIAEEDLVKWTKRVTPAEGDLVFSYEATLHRYALIPKGFRGCLGRRLGLVRVNPKLIDNRFLFYVFLSPYWRGLVISNTQTGATVDRLPLIRFPDFEVPVPPLPTQKRIADILSAYDELIEVNRRSIQLLEESARRIYKEWFVKFKFPDHEKVKIVDGLPVGWKRVCLLDLLELQRGFDLPAQDRLVGNVPIYASTGIIGFHNEAKVNGPGLITGRSGSLGTVMLSRNDFWPLNTTLWVKKFKAVSPIYGLFLLQSLNIESYNGGVAVPTVNRNNLHKIEVVGPIKSVMEKFDAIIDPIFKAKEQFEKQIQALEEARNRLLPRLMSGRIDVGVG